MSSIFPDPTTAGADGVVAVTDTMNAAMVLDAYSHGIFPWSTGPVRWFSPDPRAIFEPGHIHVSHSLQREMRAGTYRVTFDTAFVDVMHACAEAHAATRVWISDLFVSTYSELHQRGYAHSAEVWHDTQLVGGIYGLQIGAMFAGESMFHRVDNASKIAFAYLARHVIASGTTLIDTQVLNNHTRSLGAQLIPRRDFLARVRSAVSVNIGNEGQFWPHEPPPWAGTAIPPAALAYS